MINFKEVYKREKLLLYLNEYIPDFTSKIEKLHLSKKNKYITLVTKLGESKKLGINIFEIDHKSEKDPRVTISREAFVILRNYFSKQSLVIFRNEKTKNYRLSLITFQSFWDRGARVRVKLSNPRRHSFFLGPEAKINTPTKFLVSRGKIVNFDDLKSRFSIEVVNKEFYKEISQVFTKLVSGQLKLPSTQDKSHTNLEFAVRLIGRIIFCWFLREKKSESGLSLMPKKILSIEAIQKQKDYYHSILEPIFFEVLNKPVKSRREDFAKEPFSSVPYLNGGLFSPQEDDFYKRTNGDFQSQHHNTLVIPDIRI